MFAYAVQVHAFKGVANAGPDLYEMPTKSRTPIVTDAIVKAFCLSTLVVQKS